MRPSAGPPRTPAPVTGEAGGPELGAPPGPPGAERIAVEPFEIEELFPGHEAGSGRLPRRQAGPSPQGLAVTLIADYTLRTRAWLPSAAIVALLGEFGVGSGAARTTISRLARRGVLESGRHGRHSSYRLTKDAAADLRGGGGSIAGFTANADSWDGTWTLVTFSVPEEQSAQRHALRTALRWRGYAPLYDAVWISPRPLTARAQADLAELALGAMSVFRARHVELATQANRDPVEAWDLPGIARQYEDFIGWGRKLLRRVDAGRVDGAAAVRARTEVMDGYRRFPVLDPLLPVDLLPRRWPRARAREICVAIYDGLAGPAREHVRDVVARYDGGRPDDISTHTIAEMGAGPGDGG